MIKQSKSNREYQKLLEQNLEKKFRFELNERPDSRNICFSGNQKFSVSNQFSYDIARLSSYKFSSAHALSFSLALTKNALWAIFDT